MQNDEGHVLRFDGEKFFLLGDLELFVDYFDDLDVVCKVVEQGLAVEHLVELVEPRVFIDVLWHFPEVDDVFP